MVEAPAFGCVHYHEGTKNTKGHQGTKSPTIKNSPETLFQRIDVEVDEETEPEILKSEISQKLSRMEGSQSINGFYLYHYAFFNQQVELNMAVESLPLVADWHADLTLDTHTPQP